MWTENLVKFVYVVFEICKWTDNAYRETCLSLYSVPILAAKQRYIHIYTQTARPVKARVRVL